MSNAFMHSPAAFGSCLPWEALDRDLPILAARYRSGFPYPHIAIADFLVPDAAARLAVDFPQPSGEAWINYRHFNEHKFGQTKRALFPDSIGAVIDELNSPRFESGKIGRAHV